MAYIPPRSIQYAAGASGSPFGQSPNLYAMQSGANTPTMGLPNYSQMSVGSPNYFQNFSQMWKQSAPQAQSASVQRPAAPSYGGPPPSYSYSQQAGQNQASQIVNQMMQTQNTLMPYNPQLSFAGSPNNVGSQEDIMRTAAQRQNQMNEYGALVQQQMAPYQQQLGNLAQQNYQQSMAAIPGNVRLPGGGWTKGGPTTPGGRNIYSQRMNTLMQDVSNPYQYLSDMGAPLSYQNYYT